MISKSEKLEAIAAEVDIDIDTLTQYLHGELSPMKAQFLIPGHKLDAINQALSANGEGIFLILVSPRELMRRVGQGHSDYIGVIREGMRATASASGYHTLYEVTNKYIADEAYFRTFLSKFPDVGMISIIPQSDEILAAVCADLNMPCLLMDYVSDALPDGIHTLNVDNYQGSFDAVQHLIELGHQRIAYLAGFLDFHSAQARLAGYRDALAQAGIAYDESIVEEGDWTSVSGGAFMNALLQQSPRPTALVAANDVMAVGALVEAKKQGVDIPLEMSIVGCDDIPMATSISPTLTTLRQHMQQMGAMAADVIIRLLKGEQLDERHHMLPLELVIRESTARMKASG